MNEQINNSTPANEKTKCPSCGFEMDGNAKFCPQCGQTLASAAPAESVAPVVPVESSVPAVSADPAATVAPVKKSNKLLFVVLGAVAVIAVLVAALLGFVFREIPVEAIVLSESAVELKVEESKNVSCTVYPEKATDKTVVWTSSDSSVATVNSLGMITAVGKGNCTVTVQAGDVKQTISVTVKSSVDLQKIYDDHCSSAWASLGSDKSYLSVDTNPYNRDDGDYTYLFIVNDAIEKIHKALGLPDSLYEDMNNTTWSMGKQNESFEEQGIIVSWTYHPDKGLEVTYKLLAN